MHYEVMREIGLTDWLLPPSPPLSPSPSSLSLPPSFSIFTFFLLTFSSSFFYRFLLHLFLFFHLLALSPFSPTSIHHFFPPIPISAFSLPLPSSLSSALLHRFLLLLFFLLPYALFIAIFCVDNTIFFIHLC